MSNHIAENDPFVAPATGGTLKSLKGMLLLVFPTEIGKSKSKFPTKDGSGMVDHVICKIVAIDHPDGPKVIHRIKIMSGSMYGQIAPYVGTDRPALGRLGMDTFEMGDGWVLEAETLTDADLQSARDWMMENPMKKPTDPFTKAAKPSA
jgi:hypothetical protein